MKQARKACQWLALLSVSTARANKFYSFRQTDNVRILKDEGQT
jgi:hypothetical protein